MMRVPRAFEHRVEIYNAMLKNPQTAHMAHNLATYDKLSNLPKTAWAKKQLVVRPSDKDTYQECKRYEETVIENVFNGKGLYLFGTMGSGKTSWAYRIAIRYMELASSRNITNRPVYYANVPSLMNDIKAGFEDVELAKQIRVSIEDSDIVIFDDIGAENGTEFAKEQLYSFINNRYANGKVCIFTSNLPLSRLQPRLADRILEMCTILEFKGTSRRK